MAHVATVTIDNTQVPSDQTDFVVYVKLEDTSGWAGFWSTVASGGGDIRCYKSDGVTELARDVVSCDTTGKTGELHIRYSGTLSSSVDTEIQIHADGTSSDYAETATYGRNNVWQDYEAVFHLDDGADSAGNAGTLSTNGTSSFGNTGKIGDAADIASGNSNYLNISSSGIADFTTSTALTAQFWVNRDSDNTTDTYEEIYLSVARPDGFTIGLGAGGNLTLYTDGGNTGGRAGAATLGLSSWFMSHISWDQPNTTVRHYIDGLLDGTEETGYSDTSSQTSPNIWVGSVDGFNTARS